MSETDEFAVWRKPFAFEHGGQVLVFTEATRGAGVAANSDCESGYPARIVTDDLPVWYLVRDGRPAVRTGLTADAEDRLDEPALIARLRTWYANAYASG